MSDLSERDLTLIDRVCDGIPLFDGLKAKDLKLIANNFSTIALSTGCPSQCSHCCFDAEKTMKFMDWDNFTKLVDSLALLKKRLGFNPLCMNASNPIERKHDPEKDYLYFFEDTEPMLYRSKGKNIYDAADISMIKQELKPIL